MSDDDTVTYLHATAVPQRALSSSSYAPGPVGVTGPVTFTRAELREIMGLYGRRVAEGEWRDYAMDFSAQKAVFAVFRRSAEHPLYVIEKNPALTRRQGAFSVTNAQGFVLRRGHDLRRVLGVLEKKPALVRS
ncbi:MAG: DUF2794 domain-containing protein [Hyphomicrobiales bacterium]|nr:DUF2794 domain-containing protein [Hyphomicrobiales bacterium]